MVERDGFEHRVLIEADNPSICIDDSKCKKCKLCQKACQNDISIHGFYDWEKTGHRAICVNCGQCVQACPFGAITIKDNTDLVLDAIAHPHKIVVFITAPAVRVGLGDAFGLEPGAFAEKNMVSALRKLGADYVLDVVFGADLTIMEEAHELVDRIKNGKTMPMFTSCCPGWVRFAEMYYPDMIPNLSSCKSPIAMQATMVKTYFAKKMNISKDDIVVVAVAPCTAKKAEANREELSVASIKDCDITITTVELAELIKRDNIDFNDIENSEFDSILGTGSSSGLIFGNTGGVMQAAVRTAFYYMTGRNMTEDEITTLNPIRTLENTKIAEVNINATTIRVAAVSGLAEARKLIEEIRKGEIKLDFVEVMACKGGCANGGGQPKVLRKPMQEASRIARNEGLYKTDNENQKLRFCHDNPEIKALYDEYLVEPGSEQAHELLHTRFIDRSSELGEK